MSIVKCLGLIGPTDFENDCLQREKQKLKNNYKTNSTIDDLFLVFFNNL